jgi:pimeloyl-ACP methyl ester carboxylesterase
LVAWFFSRRPTIDVLGMHLMGFAADVVLSCKPAGLMSALFRYGTTDGFARASASWLGFDASARWPTLQPPLLWLAYPRDHMAGVSLDAARAEFAAVKAAQGPASRSKFVEVSVTGEEAHCRMCEAPDEYVGELMAFVRGVAADSKT